MTVLPPDRDELVRRVTRKLAGTRVRPAVVGQAVDRVLAALPREQAAPAVGSRVVVIHRENTPDLASRWRQRLPAEAIVGLAVASEGRHTVVVARVTASQLEAARAGAAALGASCAVKELE